jgi:hypothetical protein
LPSLNATQPPIYVKGEAGTSGLKRLHATRALLRASQERAHFTVRAYRG